jgi:hypothetical protein
MHKTNVFMLLARGRIALAVPAAYMPVIMAYERRTASKVPEAFRRRP